MIDEYAMILRNVLWVKPEMEPTIALVVIIIIKIFSVMKFTELFIKITKGANFWITKSNLTDFHDKPFITEGNHWWKGAPATFIMSASTMSRIVVGLVVVVKLSILIRMIAEAILWMRKYFKAHSLWYLLFLLMIRGIKTIMLISKAVHIISQEWVEIIIRIDNNIISRKNIFTGWRNITI